MRVQNDTRAISNTRARVTQRMAPLLIAFQLSLTRSCVHGTQSVAKADAFCDFVQNLNGLLGEWCGVPGALAHGRPSTHVAVIMCSDTFACM